MVTKFKNRFKEIFNLKSVYKLKRKLITKENIIVIALVIIAIFTTIILPSRSMSNEQYVNKINNFTYSKGLEEEIYNEIDDNIINAIRYNLYNSDKEAYLDNIEEIKKNDIKNEENIYKEKLISLKQDKLNQLIDIRMLYDIASEKLDILDDVDKNIEYYQQIIEEEIKRRKYQNDKEYETLKQEYDNVITQNKEREKEENLLYEEKLLEIQKEANERRGVINLDKESVVSYKGYYFYIYGEKDLNENPIIRSEPVDTRKKGTNKISIKYYIGKVPYTTVQTSLSGPGQHSKELLNRISDRIKKEYTYNLRKNEKISEVKSIVIDIYLNDLENSYGTFYASYKNSIKNTEENYIKIILLVRIIAVLLMILGIKFYDKLLFKVYRVYRKSFIEPVYIIFILIMYKGMNYNYLGRAAEYIGILTLTFISSILIGSDIGYILDNGFRKLIKERSLIRKIFYIFSKNKEDNYERKLIRKNIIYIVISIVYFGVAIYYYDYGYRDIYFIMFIIYSSIIIYNNYKYTKDIIDIEDASTKIAEGNFNISFKSNRVKDLNNIRENLSNINKGFKIAIEDEIKSERMKSELLTNVSHDLKTPLTSIINYVDLLQRDNLTEQQKEEYIKILDNKSKRLKVLIEDLFEASKASTGNIKLNKEDIDIVAILRQSMGEFKEKIDEKNLNFKINIPNNKIILNLDGARTWRVFENIIGNALKYSMEHTRVYIDLRETSDEVIFEIKNISGYELNCEVSELKERFKRADLSRNTEGSGLGLSIANSLVELQGGKLDISIDGDLFKVKVIFKK